MFNPSVWGTDTARGRSCAGKKAAPGGAVNTQPTRRAVSHGHGQPSFFLGAVRWLRREPRGNRTNFPPSYLSYRGCVVPLVILFQTLHASQSIRDGLPFFGVHSR